MINTIATGPAIKRKKFPTLINMLISPDVFRGPQKNTALYIHSIKPMIISATIPYMILIFPLSDLSSLLPRKSMVNPPQVNITTAAAIMMTSRNFIIATVLPLPQKFCAQKK